MPAHRCSLCAINYPKQMPCGVCGGKTDYIITAGPDPDWEATVARALSEREDSGYQALVAHRTARLLDLGFSIEQVDLLPLNRADIAHDAERLLKRGATHAFVIHDLKED